MPAWRRVMMVMSLIEVVWFGPAMGVPASVVPGLFLGSLPLVILFVPLTVWILGGVRPWHAVSTAARGAYARLQMPALQWVWKLAVIAAAYLVFYFGFGFVVAWQNPALRDLYGGGADQAVFDWWRLIPFQLFRGVLWTLFALPVIAMDRGPAWKTAIVVGLWLALPMNIAHAVPNPLIPDATVRLSHFVETATSNFLFGMFLAGVVLWRPQRKPHAAAGQAAA